MDLSDRMGGAVHLVFPDEKKGGKSQTGETDFLPCSDRVYSRHCTLPSDRSAKSFRRGKSGTSTGTGCLRRPTDRGKTRGFCWKSETGENYTVCTGKSLQRRRDRRGIWRGDRGVG